MAGGQGPWRARVTAQRSSRGFACGCFFEPSASAQAWPAQDAKKDADRMSKNKEQLATINFCQRLLFEFVQVASVVNTHLI